MEGYNGHVRPLDSLVRARGWRLFNVNNLKLARPDPGTALAQDSRAQMRAQLWPAKVARQPRLRLGQRDRLLQRPSDLTQRTLPRAASPYSASDTKRWAGWLKPEESLPEKSSK